MGNGGCAANLAMLTFALFGIPHRLDKLTDLWLAAVHRLANSFVLPALLEHLGNPNGPALRIRQQEKAILGRPSWTLSSLNVIKFTVFSVMEEHIRLVPLPDRTIILEIF
jgi:hypothetical protein